MQPSNFLVPVLGLIGRFDFILLLFDKYSRLQFNAELCSLACDTISRRWRFV